MEIIIFVLVAVAVVGGLLWHHNKTKDRADAAGRRELGGRSKSREE